MKKRFKEPTTTYKQGGKSDWISNKIAEIMHEGKYKQDQAIAIAYSMYNELPKHQTGRAPIQPVDNMQPMGYSFNQMPTTQGMPPQGGMYQPPLPAGMQVNSPMNYNMQAPTAEQMYSQTDPYLFQSSQNPPQANAAPNSNPSATLASTDNSYLQPNKLEAYSDANTGAVTDATGDYTRDSAHVRNSYQMYTPQFYNPENLAVYAGMNAKKNPVMAGVAGVGAVAGIGRAFLSGMAGENRNTQIGQDYASAQRDKLTGYNNPEQMSAGTGANYNTMSYRQDGGEQMQQQAPQQEGQQGSQEGQVVQFIQEALQQQADPQEIAQQLIQMGMQPEQVQQLISAVMQQMQGGEQQQDMSQQSPDQQQDMGLSQQQDQMQDAQQYKNGGQYINQLIGKKITGYKLNNQTGNYEVTYE